MIFNAKEIGEVRAGFIRFEVKLSENEIVFVEYPLDFARYLKDSGELESRLRGSILDHISVKLQAPQKGEE